MKHQAVVQPVIKPRANANPMKDIVWRLERLERQVQKLSELVRKHEHKVRVRRHLRDVSSKNGLDS